MDSNRLFNYGVFMNDKIKQKLYMWVLYIQLTVCLLVLLVLFYLHFWAYKNRIVVDVCLFYYRTNLLCPLCGGTRALYNLLQVDIIYAMRCNALILLIPLVIAVVIIATIRLITKDIDKSRLFKQTRFLVTFLFFLIIIFWVVRNIPAFVLLRPV